MARRYVRDAVGSLPSFDRSQLEMGLDALKKAIPNAAVDPYDSSLSVERGHAVV